MSATIADAAVVGVFKNEEHDLVTSELVPKSTLDPVQHAYEVTKTKKVPLGVYTEGKGVLFGSPKLCELKKDFLTKKTAHRAEVAHYNEIQNRLTAKKRQLREYKKKHMMWNFSRVQSGHVANLEMDYNKLQNAFNSLAQPTKCIVSVAEGKYLVQLYDEADAVITGIDAEIYALKKKEEAVKKPEATLRKVLATIVEERDDLAGDTEVLRWKIEANPNTDFKDVATEFADKSVNLKVLDNAVAFGQKRVKALQLGPLREKLKMWMKVRGTVTENIYDVWISNPSWGNNGIFRSKRQQAEALANSK